MSPSADRHGFVDVDAARAVVRRLKLRHKLSAAQASITCLLNSLDQAGNADRCRVAAAIESGSELRDGDLEGGVGGEPVDRVESQHMREQELLQGVDLILQFLNALHQGLAHGRFSSIRSNSLDATSASPAAHRLSDEASRT